MLVALKVLKIYHLLLIDEITRYERVVVPIRMEENIKAVDHELFFCLNLDDLTFINARQIEILDELVLREVLFLHQA